MKEMLIESKAINSLRLSQWVDQNWFFPFSDMGNETGFCFGERDAFTEVSSEGGDQWCNPQADFVSPRSLDGVELLQDGLEPLLLQWKHSGVNSSGFFHGEEESCSLDCPPLSRWDSNGQSELVVTLEVEEGEILGLEVVNSKLVVSLMKSFCKNVGFPIVKHEGQCLALFHLLEQDFVDVDNSGSSKGPVNSRQKGLRELRGLISTVNYDGVSSKGRNQGSSAGLGVITSFK